MLSSLLMFLVPSVSAEPGAAVGLEAARARAALAAGDPETAAVAAAAALAADDGDWRGWWSWRQALLGLGAETQLAQEAALLVQDSDPWRAWVGRTWSALANQELPGVDPEVPGTIWFAALGALEQGRDQRVLDLVAGQEAPLATALRLAALESQKKDREALGQARALRRAAPDRLDLLAPACELETRGASALRRGLVVDAAEMLDTDDVLALYRAHALLVACDETSLAMAASVRLQALGEPLELGGRQPWGGAMIRDLGRVLAMQSTPEAPAGGNAQETQRILVSTARELQERGRTEESLALWRRAMGLCDAPPSLGLEAAEVERRRGDPEQALVLARAARSALALAAVDPGEQARQVRLTAETWRVEALVLRSRGDSQLALAAAAQAVSVGSRSRDLVLWGELLEEANAPRAALQAYSRAAAQGYRGLEARLERLYEGPVEAEALVASWRIVLEEDPRSHAVQEARGARLPSRTLATTAGPLRIGDAEGEWLVVNFWASWCGPCQRELPELAELAAQVEQEGLPVRILAVSLDDRRGEYEAWISTRDTGGLVLAWDPDLGRVLQLRSIPTTLLVDPQGLVQETRRGYRPGDGERLLAELRPHLEPDAEE